MNKKSITKKLILGIVFFSSLITIVLTSIQLYVEYKGEIKDIHRIIKHIKIAYLPSVTSILWTDDKDELGVILKGINELPEVNYISIKVNDKNYISSGVSNPNNSINESFPINYDYNNLSHRIGTLYVEADLINVYKRLLNRFWIILASNAFKTFLVAIFIFYLVERIIINKLQQISQFIDSHEENNFKNKLNLTGRVKGSPPDEIEKLADGLNNMQLRLSRSFRQLEESELETRLLLDSSGEGIYGIDTNGNCTFANSKCIELLGYASEDDLFGENMHSLIHHSHVDGSEYLLETCHIYQSLKNGKPAHNINDVFWRKDGSSFPVGYTSSPIINHDIIIGSVITFRNITERKQLEAYLIQAMNNAQIASKAKTEFLSSMSHELRTPLNSVIGFSQILQMESDSLNSDQVIAADSIFDAGMHLLSLVEDVLKLSDLETGKIEINLENMNPIKCIQHCVDLTLAAANKNDVTLTHNIQGLSVPDIRVDRDMLQQIIINLLSNAVKYNRKGGSVTIEYETIENSMLRIKVIDTGCGIAQDKYNNVFAAFNRLGHENSSIEGTGIGLNITQKLIESMDGKIDFESIVDKGTTFWVDFRLA